MAGRQWPLPGPRGGFVNEDGTEQYPIPPGFFGEDSAALQTVSPTGIASAEAFGTVAISTSITITVTGIASAEAMGVSPLLILETYRAHGLHGPNTSKGLGWKTGKG